MYPARPANISPPTNTANWTYLIRSQLTITSNGKRLCRNRGFPLPDGAGLSRVPETNPARNNIKFAPSGYFSLSKTTTDLGDTTYFFTPVFFSESSCSPVSNTTFHVFVLFTTGK